MSDKHLDAYLDGELCGTFAQTASGNLGFDYHASYRRDPEATPISLSMPPVASHHKRRAALPYLQGLLPDNVQALNAIAGRFGVSVNGPFAMLQHIGKDVAGALQLVEPGERVPDRDDTRSDLRAVSERDVADMLERAVTEYRDGVAYDDGAGRFSLAGAQPKIALHRAADGRWFVPLDATPTTHILKPVTTELRRVDVVELLTLHAAQQLGNDVASATLETVGSWDVLVSRRYDREFSGGEWRRLHQEDLCQSLSVMPQKKYQHREGGPGVAAIAALIRQLPLAADRRAVAERFFTALVFNVVAGCPDAHAKNYSLVLSGRSVRLAPLYDLITFAPYWSGATPLNSAMSIDGEYSLGKIGVAGLVSEGVRLGLERGAAREVVENTITGMLPAFDAARAVVAPYGAEAIEIADAVLRGLRRLPLLA